MKKSEICVRGTHKTSICTIVSLVNDKEELREHTTPVSKFYINEMAHIIFKFNDIIEKQEQEIKKLKLQLK